MVEKIWGFFKNVFSKDDFLSQKEVIKKLNEEKNKLFNIFKKISERDSFNLSESIILDQEIQNVLKETYDFLEGLEENAYKYVKSKRLKAKFHYILLAIIFIIGMLLCFVPVLRQLGIFLGILNLYNIYKIFEYTGFSPLYNEDEFVPDFREILNITNNSLRFLNKRTKNYEESLKLSTEEIAMDIALEGANEVITFYMSTGIIPHSMPDDVRNIIIRLLQDDLKTDETDLKILFSKLDEKVELELKEKGQKLYKDPSLILKIE